MGPPMRRMNYSDRGRMVLDAEAEDGVDLVSFSNILIFVALNLIATGKYYCLTSVGYPALPGTNSQFHCKIVPCRLI